jgi:hypothetical protein
MATSNVTATNDYRDGWRKLLDSSFTWQRSDGSYSSIGGTDVIDGLLFYCIQKDIVDNVFGRGTSSFVNKYFKKTKTELSNNIIEDYCKKDGDAFRGTLVIESRSKDEAKKHRVRICDVVSKNSKDERKEASLRNMIAQCSCPKTHFQSFRVAPVETRKFFNDGRFPYDIPSPHVSMVMDNHAVTAYDSLVEERGAEDFGVLGLTDHTLGIASSVIKSVLDKGYKSEYELNYFLRDRTDLFNPLRKRLDIKPLV